MITLHLSKPDIAHQALNEWCDLLLMADAMEQDIALLLDEAALALLYEGSALMHRIKALQYSDLREIWIYALSIDNRTQELLSASGFTVHRLSYEEYCSKLGSDRWVITL